MLHSIMAQQRQDDRSVGLDIISAFVMEETGNCCCVQGHSAIHTSSVPGVAQMHDRDLSGADKSQLSTLEQSNPQSTHTAESLAHFARRIN